jgi:dTDP-4-amino-4,6-dideoxygalactose transaminase
MALVASKKYNSWPCGKLPPCWQREELTHLKNAGYKFDDPMEVVDIFEKKIAKYAGSPYAVAVDNCTDAIFLALMWHKHCLGSDKCITIPSHSYLSIPMAIRHAGFRLDFEDIDWSGVYQLKPLNIYDSATRFTEGMYIPGSTQCLSFQIKKRLPIGKGGMILCSGQGSYRWLRQARYEARHMHADMFTEAVDQWHDEFDFLGWNMYMTPEDAARGILIFDELTETHTVFPDSGDQDNYPDLSKQKIFQ